MNFSLHKNKKRDRSLSVDVNNENLSFVNTTHIMPSSGTKTAGHSRTVSHKQITPQESMTNILDDSRINSSTNSPRYPKLFKSSGLTSQLASNTKSRRDSRSVRHERIASICIDNDSELDKSVSKTVKLAYEMQAGKEKEISQKKEDIEKEIATTKKTVHDLTNKLRIQRDCLNSRQTNILSMLKDVEKLVNNEVIISEKSQKFKVTELLVSGEDFEKDIEKRELSKTLIKINKNLSLDLRDIYDLVHKSPEVIAQTIQKRSLRSLINNIESRLQALLDDKNLLVHKIYETEDRLNQAREIKNMIAEDLASNVEAMTESVVLHEETESLLENLRSKNPEFYDIILNEIKIEDKFLELGFEIKSDEENIIKLLKEAQEEKHSLDKSFERHTIFIREIKELHASEAMYRQEILNPKLSIFDKTKEALKLLPGQISENLLRLINYFKIFDVKSHENILKKISKENQENLINFQNTVIEEICFFHQNKQEIENLESTIIRLQNKIRESHDVKHDTNITIKSIQDEILCKKLLLTEKSVQYESKKRAIIDEINNDQDLEQFLSSQLNFSFLEIYKKLNSSTPHATLKKLDQIILILANSARDNYSAYLEIKNLLIARQTEIDKLTSGIKELQKSTVLKQQEAESLKNGLVLKKAQEDEMRIERSRIQELCQNAVLKGTEKAFQDYLTEQEKKLKKLKFQFGKNFINKFSNGKINEYLVNQSSNISKLKIEIIQAQQLLASTAKHRTHTNNIIENELKVELVKAKLEVQGFSKKLDSLNKDLHEILRKEEELITCIENEDINPKNKTSEDNSKNSGNVYNNIQAYRKLINEILNLIIIKLTKPDEQGKSSSVQKAHVQVILKKIIDELNLLTDTEMRLLEDIEKELKEKKDLCRVKENQLSRAKDDLDRSRNNLDISKEFFKTHYEKESSLNTSNILIGVSTPIHKRMYSCKSSSKLNTTIQHERSYSKPNFEISRLINFNNDILSPKVLTETTNNNILSGIDTSSTRSMTRNASTINFSGLKSSDRSQLMETCSSSKSRPCSNKISPPITKFQLLTKHKWRDFGKDMIEGVPILKKFMTNTSYIGPNSANFSITKSLKQPLVKDLKRFGKRTLKVNPGKNIEIIKLAPTGNRPMVEYTYEWKNIKKVFIPEQTMEIIKKQPLEKTNMSDNPLAFAIDVVNVGRVDLLSCNPGHIAALWHAFHQSSSVEREIVRLSGKISSLRLELVQYFNSQLCNRTF